ncbi:hypothetical protein VNO77_24676 [Canavalia gladiata]|uniref:Uncharacterized protein n=1 Tax=Canavalia gladiata TaxID=3824 RepID=A0AAN9L7G7_CANGL
MRLLAVLKGTQRLVAEEQRMIGAELIDDNVWKLHLFSSILSSNIKASWRGSLFCSICIQGLGDLIIIHILFEKMEDGEVISGTYMIGEFARDDFSVGRLVLFQKMLEVRIKVNDVNHC